MAKFGNDTTLSRSKNQAWDTWGALCQFTSWERAANALGITRAALINARKKPIRRTMRLAMNAILAERDGSIRVYGPAVGWQLRGFREHKGASQLDHWSPWIDCRQDEYEKIKKTGRYYEYVAEAREVYATPNLIQATWRCDRCDGDGCVVATQPSTEAVVACVKCHGSGAMVVGEAFVAGEKK